MDLPNTENRVKILRVILADEELEEGFDFEELSRITDGYSGSDLKVLHCCNPCCIRMPGADLCLRHQTSPNLSLSSFVRVDCVIIFCVV